MNSKANKQQIQFPPVLNLCNDRPHVDSSFRNWEKVNAPYLNDMISPVYLKTVGKEAVYDINGDIHTIKSNKWQVNSVNVSSESHTNSLNKVQELSNINGLNPIAYVLTGNDTLNFVYQSTANKLTKATYTISTGSVSNTTVLDDYSSYTVLDCRMVGVYTSFYVIDNLSDTHYVMLFRDSTLIFKEVATWIKQILPTVDNQSLDDISWITVSPSNINPICNIGIVSSTIVVVSWINNYGSTLDSRHNGFITYYVSGSSYHKVDSNYTPYIPAEDVTIKYNLYNQWVTTYKNPVGQSGSQSTTEVITDFSLYDTSRILVSGSYMYVWLNSSTANGIFNLSGSNLVTESRWWQVRSFTADEDTGLITSIDVMYNYLSDAGDYGSSLTVKSYAWTPRFTNGATKEWQLDSNGDGRLITFNGYNTSTSTTLLGSVNSVCSLIWSPQYMRTTKFAFKPATTWSDIYNSNNFDKISSYLIQVCIYNANYTASGNTMKIDVVGPFDDMVASGSNGIWKLDLKEHDVSEFDGLDELSITVRLIYPYGTPAGYTYVYNTNTFIRLTDSYNNTTKYTFADTGKTLTIDYYGVERVDSLYPQALPCVALNDGKMYAMFDFEQSTYENKYLISGRPIVWSAQVGTTNTSSHFQFEYLTEVTSVTSSNNVVRSLGYVVNQDFFSQTGKILRNGITPSELLAGSAESTDAEALEWYNSNVTDMKYMPGTSRWTGFNYYADYVLGTGASGDVEDNLVYNTIGSRVPINGTGWQILYNTTTSNTTLIQALSYSKYGTDVIGTLVTPWSTVEERVYVTAYDDTLVYTNTSGNIIIIQLGSNDVKLTPVLGGRFIISNTTSYYNMYCAVDKKMYHFASDWNFRVLFGKKELTTMGAYFASVYTFNIKAVASSQNRLLLSDTSGVYSTLRYVPVGSIQLPYYTKCRVITDSPTLYGADEPQIGLDNKGIELYFTTTAGSSTSVVAQYKYNYVNGGTKLDPKLINTTYTNSTTIYNPCIFATFIDGAGNNDLVVEDGVAYSTIYYSNKPMFGYKASTGIYGAESLFVIQGQFYAVIEDKLCVIRYSSGAISDKTPIIDVSGMKFVGNNPSIAFFWSERYKAFYSFTGDAILEHLYNADKFSDISGSYYYDESSQSIFIPTSSGLLVFGPKNSYLLEQFTNTSLVMFSSDGVTHIEDNGTNYSMVYYSKDGYSPNNVELESSFFGIGATEDTTIDRWNITLYDLDGTKPTGDVIVGVRSLTDITVRSEDKKIHITPDMWDDWSNSIMITYNPKLIKGQGIRVYVESPFIIQQVTAHVADVGTGTLTNKRSSI